MREVALIMAGGRGQRMRASGVDIPKPLVLVRGVPLIEHNLYQLLRHGCRDIVVAVPAAPADLETFAHDRLAAVAAAAGARLHVLVESTPLGNIGCAGSLRDSADALLTVYADNLTTLDLGQLLRHHGKTGAALTLSVHHESFRLPYGRVSLDADRVTHYDEKPQISVPVCSAFCVLGPAAMAALSPTRPSGLADLTGALLRRGERVIAFRHNAPWVDVNDRSGLEQAEALVDAHPDAFASPR